VRTGSTAVVGGSIAGLGTQYVLGLHAHNCATGDLLDQQQMQAAQKEDVLNVLSRLATQFRTRVGESLATVRQHSTPLEESSTASLDALKAYSAAIRALGRQRRSRCSNARVEIDPRFRDCAFAAGLTTAVAGRPSSARRAPQRRTSLREHATDRDRFFIMTIYDRQVTGNLEKEGQTLRLWAQTYPRDPVAPGLTAGFYAAGTGQYDADDREGQEGHCHQSRRRARSVRRTTTVVWGYISLGRPADAEEAHRQAMTRADPTQLARMRSTSPF
jgi:hypothetical protein